jgi:hypothetical protein
MQPKSSTVVVSPPFAPSRQIERRFGRILACAWKGVQGLWKISVWIREAIGGTAAVQAFFDARFRPHHSLRERHCFVGAGSYPSHSSTGSLGYFANRVSVADNWHNQKTALRSDSTRRACMQSEQSPTRRGSWFSVMSPRIARAASHCFSLDASVAKLRLALYQLPTIGRHPASRQHLDLSC